MSLNGFTGRAIVTRDLNKPNNRYTCTLALVDSSGEAWAPSGAEVKLTGYTTGSAGNIAATDTINQALAKLEARIADLETP